MNILFLTSNLVPPFSGDSIFSLGLAARLAEKYEITLISFGEQDDWDKSPVSDCIQDYHLIKRSSNLSNKFWQIVKYGSLLQMHSKEYINKVKFILNNKYFDYIIIDHLRTYSMYKSAKNQIDGNKTQVIYMAHNIEFKNHQQKLKNIPILHKRLIYSFINRKIRQLELELISHVDKVWALAQKDLDELKESVQIKESEVISPFFPWETIKPRASLKRLSKKIMILGSMQWYPNVQGALHFIQDIFPEVLAVDPDYKLYIVGQKPDQQLVDLQSEHIIVTGRVPSVDPFIKEADLLVIPNRHGSGIKIKLFESIIKGLPVIMYKENIEGYDKSTFNYPFVVDSSEQFVEAIFDINNNAKLKGDFLDYHLKTFNSYRDFDFQF